MEKLFITQGYTVEIWLQFGCELIKLVKVITTQANWFPPRYVQTGRERTITPTWEGELPRVQEMRGALPLGRWVRFSLHNRHPGTLIYAYLWQMSPQNATQYLSRLYQAWARTMQIGVAVKCVNPTIFDCLQ